MRAALLLIPLGMALVLPACTRGASDASPRVVESALQPNAPDGYRLTLTGAVDAPAGAPAVLRAMITPTLSIRVRDGKGRIDFGGSAPAPGVAQGSYVLLDARTHEAVMVVPELKEVTRFDSTGRDSAEGPPLEVVDTVSRIEALGVGDTVLGIPTRKYRVTIGYGLQSPGAVNSPLWRTEIVRTVHVSDRMAALDPVFAQFSDLARATPVVNASLRASTARTIDALGSRRPPGFVLLLQTEMRSIVRADTTRSLNTWRVTEFRMGGVTAADVAVPAGFAARSFRDARTARF